ncbi:DUF2256 domain-containing protein [Chenggangzhangella methanolivorans]|uniref:DUF2256 domain-containing protein n=1 Tax=Chenggangzhangella methanolivorans TaxID=1437009 RepID=UPI00361029D4
MPKRTQKSDLPTKTCPVCGRPFAWRKKWERVWDEVLYCSERCRRAKTAGEPKTATSSPNITKQPYIKD